MTFSLRWTAAALAIALCAHHGATTAQSSVAINGRVDVGVQRVSDGASTLNRVDSGTATASRIIFRGMEDLGDGLSAGFFLESRFNADTGTQQNANKFWNAESTVNLSSTSWGKVLLGRQFVPMFFTFLWSDDSGNLRLQGYSATQIVQRGSTARIAAAASPVKRAGTLDSIAGGIYQVNITNAMDDNIVAYRTPSLGGLTAMLALASAEGVGRFAAANLEYNIASLYAGLAYQQKKGNAANTGPNTQALTEMLASALYNVAGGLKVWGNVHPWKLESLDSTLKGRDWMLGMSYWMPTGMAWANYAAKRIDNCARCATRGAGAGYNYFLSKRTTLYAMLGGLDNEANAATGLNGLTPSAPGKNMRGVAAGLMLTF